MTHNSRETRDFELDRGGDGDTLSTGTSIERRPVHPYRDERDALIARRRARKRELEQAERAAARRDALALHLTVLDEELRARRSPLIDAVAIKTPCRARWEDMRGDDSVRHCARCNRDVHDLSQMTEGEIEALLGREASTPCVRLRRRPDGRVVTADCPLPPPSLAARAGRAVSAGVLFGASAATVAAMMTPTLGGLRRPDEMTQVAPLPEVSARQPSEAPVVDVGAFRSAARIEPSPLPDDVTMGEPTMPTQPVSPWATRTDLSGHIRWIAPQAWEVDRALVDRLELPVLIRVPRLIPNEALGGMDMYGIRRDSFLGRLGFHNGDTLIDVNGHSMGPDAGVHLIFRLLRRGNALFVRLDRDGEERLHVIRIVD